MPLTVNGKTVLKEPELIIFDKDGTIIDVHFYWTSMIRFRADWIIKELFPSESEEKKKKIFSHLVETMGIDEKSGRMKREGPVGIKPRSFIIKVVRQAVLDFGVEISEERVTQLFKDVDAQTEKNLGNYVRVLPSVENFLKDAKGAGIKLAIGTSDTTRRASEGLKQAGIGQYFDFILGGDQIQKSKPESETVDRLIQESGANRANTAVVGDHPVDIFMGKNAGLECNIGVLTGLGQREDFAPLSCHVAASFAEMGVE